MGDTVKLIDAKPGDVLRDGEGDVWFIREDGSAVGVFGNGAVVYENRSGLDDLRGPFKRLPVYPKTKPIAPPPPTTIPCHLAVDGGGLGNLRVVTEVDRPLMVLRVTEGGFFEMVRVVPAPKPEDDR